MELPGLEIGIKAADMVISVIEADKNINLLSST